MNIREFIVTFYQEEDRHDTEIAKSKLQAVGKTRFGVCNSEAGPMTFMLELFHLEFPFSYVKSALHKYVKELTVDRLLIFETIKSPFVRVTHKGYKKLFGRKLYYAPNMYGIVSEKSHMTHQELEPKCNRCLVEGH